MNLQRDLNKFILKHLLLNTKPHKIWKIIRFFLHWGSLPIKLILIGALGIFQIVKYSIKSKRLPCPNDDFNISYKDVWSKLPTLEHEQYRLYLPRQPFELPLNGRHHNPDHQTSRHGTYAFLCSKNQLCDYKTVEGLNKFILGDYLCRGFNISDIGEIKYNTSSVSGDMLSGLSLAINEIENDILNFNYEKLINSIIKNDYSLKEFDFPMEDDAKILPEIYKERLIEANFDKFNVNMKSNRATWSAGLETVGAQALTLLAALRLNQIKNKDINSGKHYKKLLWKYGYGLLSLFPTAYIDSRRGYFNEHNCIMALYILAKNAKYRWFWFIPMLYTWALSKHWHNLYFDGLFLDSFPEMKHIIKNHIIRSIDYLKEVNSSDEMIKRNSNVTEIKSDHHPVTLRKIYDDEFYPDIRRDVYILKQNDNNFHYSGLGFFADLTMKNLIENIYKN